MSRLQFWMFVFYFGKFQWFRRWVGGHWELWYIDVVHSQLWHDVGGCTFKGYPREPLMRGTPLCEDYS